MKFNDRAQAGRLLALRDVGDLGFVEQCLSWLRIRGGGAARQRRVLRERGNFHAVVDHLAVTSSTQQWPTAPADMTEGHCPVALDGEIVVVEGRQTMSIEPKTETHLRGEALVEKVKQLIHEGNVRRLIIKNDRGHTVMEIPVTAGVVAAIAAPVVTAIGAIAALASDWSIEVERQGERL